METSLVVITHGDEDFPDGMVAFQGMAHRPVGMDGVTVAPAFLVACHVAAGFEVGYDFLHPPEGQPNFAGDIFCGAAWIFRQVDEDPAVVGKECPVAFFHLYLSRRAAG